MDILLKHQVISETMTNDLTLVPAFACEFEAQVSFTAADAIPTASDGRVWFS